MAASRSFKFQRRGLLPNNLKTDASKQEQDSCGQLPKRGDIKARSSPDLSRRHDDVTKRYCLMFGDSQDITEKYYVPNFTKSDSSKPDTVRRITPEIENKQWESGDVPRINITEYPDDDVDNDDSLDDDVSYYDKDELSAVKTRAKKYMSRISSIFGDGGAGLFGQRSPSLPSLIEEMISEEEENCPNLSGHLIITSLRDGKFAAKMLLPSLTCSTLAVQISDTQLTIGKSSEQKMVMKDSRRQWTVKGKVHLPMFINMETLEFYYDDVTSCLHLNALVKGCEKFERST